MRKRIISMILAIVLIGSLFPFTAVADDGQAADPVLKLHYMMENNGISYEEACESIGLEIFSHWEVRFFLHYADGSTEPVPAQDLQLPEMMVLEEILNDGWFRFYMVGTGSVNISYEKDGAVYSMPVDVALPGLGLYSAMPFTQETLVDEINLDADHTVFYIALRPELVNNGNYISEVHTAFGPEINARNVLDIGNITVSQDGSYATLTVTDMSASGHYHFEASIANSNFDRLSTWGRSIWVNNDMPKLYFCNVFLPQDEWVVDLEYPQDEFDCPPGDSHFACFYFGTRSDIVAGNGQLLSAEDLSFPAFLNVSPLQARDPVPANALDVQVARFSNSNDDTAITYTHNGTTYTLDASSTLPAVGFYSEPEASKSAYIYANKPFTVTETERTIYLCPENPDHFRVIGIRDWNDEYLESLFTVTPSTDENGNPDGRYLALTVKDGMMVNSGRWGIEFNVEWIDGAGSIHQEIHGRSLCLKNGQKSLMWRHMDWDNTNHVWVESNNEFETRMSFQCGNEMPIQFYYGFEDDYEKLSLSDLTFPSNVMSAFMREGVLWLRVTGYEESGVITYTKGDVTVQMPVTARQPDFAFYSSTTASKSTYLGEEISLGSVNDVVYIVTDGNQTIRGFERFFNHEFGEDATDRFDVQIAADGSYATVKMKKNAEGDLPFGGRYDVQVRTDWGIRYLQFTLIRTDLPKLSTPTDLVWHKEYYWGAQNADEYMERMGVASFCGGELSQNRYQFQIYSAADNFTYPLVETYWGFGDMDMRSFFSLPDFIYSDLGSGTYKFRVRARGDGIVYRDSAWSDFSPAFVYTAPSAQLTAPDESTFAWGRWDNMYFSSWLITDEEAAGYYEINWFYEENGEKYQTARTFDINIENAINWSNIVEVGIHDDIFEMNGPVPYYFRVRVLPKDITQYRPSEWSNFSLPLNMGDVTDQVNEKLETLLPTPSDPTNVPTVEDVQQALETQTADLRAAMAADQSISGGESSGTLDLIKQLEQTVADNVDQQVEAKNSAPQEIKEIASGIEMVGATLNFADKNPGSGQTPTVTLEVAEPKEGIVIPEQQHNAVQFSMKLNGAVDKDDKREGQQLIVPVVIDMPVPSTINPDFLVVLHKLSNGHIEQIRPYIYLNETDNKPHARFVIDSFSDFALVEYDFRFEEESVTKTVGDAAFTVEAVGSAMGSEVTYESSDPTVAEVDPFTGEVTVLKAGTVTITATASAVDVYPEVVASYKLTVEAAPVITEPVTEVEASGNQVTCTVARGAVFTQMLVGVYHAETQQLIGTAMGMYDGSSNIVVVTFGFDLPDDCTLKVFCMDGDFAPQYAAAEFPSKP